jgi:hypothetical protein
VCALCHWHHVVHNLTKQQMNDAYRAVWAQSDGYGERGYIPTQGYDWSGIRDSSEESQKDMAAAARAYLAKQGITELEFSERLPDPPPPGMSQADAEQCVKLLAGRVQKAEAKPNAGGGFMVPVQLTDNSFTMFYTLKQCEAFIAKH